MSETIVVSVSCAVTIGGSFRNVKQLEEAIQERAVRAVQQLYAVAFEQYQRQWLAQRADRYVGQCWRHRQCVTPFGLVQLPTLVVRERGCARGGYHSLLRQLWRGKATRLLSPTLEKQAVELAGELNYRPAAWRLSQRCGATVSHWALWQCVQYYGEKLQQQLERDWWPDPARRVSESVVVTEMDSTYLKWQRRGRVRADREHFAMHLGLHYTGRSRRIQRRGRTDVVLDNKTWLLSTGNIGLFGTRLRRHRDRHYGAGSALSVLISDGDTGLAWVREREFAESVWLLDRWHIARAVREYVGPNEAAYRQIMGAVYHHDAEEVLEQLRTVARQGTGESDEQFRTVFGYILGCREGIDAYGQIPSRWRRRQGRLGPVVRASSGAVEKNIEVRINRRFKRQGRSWNPVRADRLAQLSWLQAQPESWPRWWDKVCLATTKVNPG